jgi:transcriptional regulator with XRE-family HTH domain
MERRLTRVARKGCALRTHPVRKQGEVSGKMDDSTRKMLKVNGEALRQLRRNAGMTIEELARKANVSARTINSYQAGKEAQISTLKLVAESLRVPFSSLLAEPYIEPTPVESARRVNVHITLSIPYEEFDQSVQLSGLIAAIQSLTNASRQISPIAVINGSTVVSLEMDEDDLPLLINAYAEQKLKPLGVTKLDLPNSLALHAIAGLVSQGMANPVLVPIFPFVGVICYIRQLLKMGVRPEVISGDRLQLEVDEGGQDAAVSHAAFSFASLPPGLIRKAIEAVTPSSLAPFFPLSVIISLVASGDSVESKSTLGEELETQLNTFKNIAPNLSRNQTKYGTDDDAWTGELVVNLNSIEDVRDLSEAILVKFLGRPVTLVTKMKKSGDFHGLKYSTDGTFSNSLSAAIWDSVAKDLAKILPTPSSP